MTGIELLGMVMMVVMLFAIFIGLPISFTLLFLALIFGYMGMGERVFNLAYLQTFGLMKQDEFVAVPMFVLMGYICDQAGLMERLFIAFRNLFAPVRGALYVVVILTATLFGIAAGTVGATVVLLGIMAGPMMIRMGYDARMSAGSIAAGGTLGILIPPSVMLVVMAPVLDISIIDLYAAAFGPGFLLSAMYIVYTLVRCYLDPKLGPPVPPEERTQSMKEILWECLVGLVPVTVLTIVTLGAILAGLTTAAEAAALGAVGALFLALCYGKFTWKGLFEACNLTMASTAMVLFLAVASNVFGAVFAWLGTANWITKMLLAAPLPAWAPCRCCSSSSSCSAGRSSGRRSCSSSCRCSRRSPRASTTTWYGSAASSPWCCRPRSCLRRWRCRRTTSSRPSRSGIWRSSIEAWRTSW